MRRIGLIAVAALLAGGVGVAAAQTSTIAPSSSTSAGKCWDSATNQVRDKAGMTGSATAPSSSTGASGSSLSGSGSYPSAGGSTGSTTTASRPPGMPNC